MKNILAIVFVFGAVFVSAVRPAHAHATGGFSNSAEDFAAVAAHTEEEEKEGGELWDKLRQKEISCTDINEGQFGALGEYVMGQMTGSAHPAMNAMMIQMHGEDGEEEIHIAMGKRFSGCDASAVADGIGGWMPMMNMMGGWSSPLGSNQANNPMMMNFGYGYGVFGWLFMLLWWILIIVAIVALVRWVARQSRGGSSGKSAIDILKERYARGEIEKTEFEEKKKELGEQ